MKIRGFSNNRELSRALVASLVLHGTILAFLGAGTVPAGKTKESRILVYLTAPQRIIQPSVSPDIPETSTAQKAAGRHTPPQREGKVRADRPKPDAKISAEASRSSFPSKPRAVKEETRMIASSKSPIPEASYVDTTLKTPLKTAEVPAVSSDQGSSITTLSSPMPVEGKLPSTPSPFTGGAASLGMKIGEAQEHGLVPARPLSLPEPVYPVLSRKIGEEGRVVLEVQVSAQGGVLAARISESSSHPRLDRAALKAVKGALFVPASEADKPVRSRTRVAYRFVLKNE